LPRAPDPLDRLDNAIERLRDADDWDETTRPEVHVHIPQPSYPDPETGELLPVGVPPRSHTTRNRLIAAFVAAATAGFTAFAKAMGWI
jgi:hypothetical protein